MAISDLSPEKNKKWYVLCGEWLSKPYQIKSEADKVKKILDGGICMCEKHKVFSLEK